LFESGCSIASPKQSSSARDRPLRVRRRTAANPVRVGHSSDQSTLAQSRLAALGCYVTLGPLTIEQWHDAFAEHLQLSVLVGERPQEDALRAGTRVRQQLLGAVLHRTDRQ
jgi:hypothetical protein